MEQKAHFFMLDMSHSDACDERAYPAAMPRHGWTPRSRLRVFRRGAARVLATSAQATPSRCSPTHGSPGLILRRPLDEFYSADDTSCSDRAEIWVAALDEGCNTLAPFGAVGADRNRCGLAVQLHGKRGELSFC